jgi:hypothetical protein
MALAPDDPAVEVRWNDGLVHVAMRHKNSGEWLSEAYVNGPVAWDRQSGLEAERRALDFAARRALGQL